MPVEQLAIQRVEQNGIAVLKLTGPLTLRTLFEFQEAAQQSPEPKTIIDLTGVPYVDSAGLGAVLSYHAACVRTGRRYAIVGVAPRVYAMLKVSRVDQLMHIFASMGEAEEALAG
jgi:anti-sigma B factor antagonist